MLRLFSLLLISVYGCAAPEPDQHEVDGPYEPIELQTGRELERVERADRGQMLLNGQDLAEYLVPRLVAMMAQAELAEGAFNRPSQQDWLRQARVDYRRIFNELNQLSRRYDYVLTADLPTPIQAQVDALARLSAADFRRQYRDLLFDQLKEIEDHLPGYALEGLEAEYANLLERMEQVINVHQDRLAELFP